VAPSTTARERGSDIINVLDFARARRPPHNVHLYKEPGQAHLTAGLRAEVLINQVVLCSPAGATVSRFRSPSMAADAKDLLTPSGYFTRGMTDARRARTRGFTLIVLSIGLVIIGLVLGAIFVGQDLIRATALRSLTGQMQR
jgi:hypothetical protein